MKINYSKPAVEDAGVCFGANVIRKEKKKYKIQLSMYGTVAERSDPIIEATSPEEAERIALEKAINGELEFTNEQNCVDGWEYQVEDCKEIGKDEYC